MDLDTIAKVNSNNTVGGHKAKDKKRVAASKPAGHSNTSGSKGDPETGLPFCLRRYYVMCF
jgi:hypothetical protein